MSVKKIYSFDNALVATDTTDDTVATDDKESHYEGAPALQTVEDIEVIYLRDKPSWSPNSSYLHLDKAG